MLPKERESCWNMALDYNLALSFSVCLFPQIYERTSLLTQWIPLELIDTLKMCLSTNEEPWTERVVNQIYIAVAGYNETINRKKCTCINNLKYQEHHNKYTKISWEEKYDNADDQCLGPPRAGIYPRPSRPRPRPTPHTTYLQIHTCKDYADRIFPFQKNFFKKSLCLGAGNVCFW